MLRLYCFSADFAVSRSAIVVKMVKTYGNMLHSFRLQLSLKQSKISRYKEDENIFDSNLYLCFSM